MALGFYRNSATVLKILHLDLFLDFFLSWSQKPSRSSYFDVLWDRQFQQLVLWIFPYKLTIWQCTKMIFPPARQLSILSDIKCISFRISIVGLSLIWKLWYSKVSGKGFWTLWETRLNITSMRWNISNSRFLAAEWSYKITSYKKFRNQLCYV